MKQHLIWRRRWHPTQVFLPGKSHRQRSLVGCSPWVHEESDTTEPLHFHFSLSCIGEGNGNPLQCSCLENPRDGEAWWAAVYGVAQSRTRLKWLSSSSSILSGHHFPSHAFSIVPHICFYSGLFSSLIIFLGFPCGSDGKASAYSVGDPGSIPGSGSSPGEGNGNPLQYSCLENPMDRGARLATVHGVTKSQTQLNDFTLKRSLITSNNNEISSPNCESGHHQEAYR